MCECENETEKNEYSFSSLFGTKSFLLRGLADMKISFMYATLFRVRCRNSVCVFDWVCVYMAVNFFPSLLLCSPSTLALHISVCCQYTQHVSEVKYYLHMHTFHSYYKNADIHINKIQYNEYDITDRRWWCKYYCGAAIVHFFKQFLEKFRLPIGNFTFSSSFGMAIALKGITSILAEFLVWFNEPLLWIHVWMPTLVSLYYGVSRRRCVCVW